MCACELFLLSPAFIERISVQFYHHLPVDGSCEDDEKETQKNSPSPKREENVFLPRSRVYVCGMKIITKNRRKIPHPSRPEARFFVVVSSSFLEIYWISKFNILSGEIPIPVRSRKADWEHTECARLLCTIRLLLCPWQLSMVCSENVENICLSQSPCGRRRFSRESSPLPRTHPKRVFRKNRKTFSPLPTPCKSDFYPETIRESRENVCL